MRKILISTLVCLLLIGSAFFMVNGTSQINVKGFLDLDEKDHEIEQKITELSNVISIEYVDKESNLKRTANTLQESKTEYENQAILSKSNNPSYASQLETYDIDFLWTKLGNFAKEEGVVIKIELVSSGTSANLYNLNFTVSGGYVGTTNFIYDIENDSKLGFKIDNFNMGAKIDYTIVSTFSCKEIPIKVGKIDAPIDEQENENNTNSTNTNTTNNTNNANSTNTNATNNTNNTNTSNNTNTATNTNS